MAGRCWPTSPPSPRPSAAAQAGADYVATTLSGYTDNSPAGPDPDIDLVRRLSRQLTVPVVAEGRYATPEQVGAAFAAGAHAVVVGTAITNPREITRGLRRRLPGGRARMTALGLDCGGSESRWVVLDDAGEQMARGTGPRMSGHIFDPAERDIAMTALRALCTDIRASAAPVHAVVAGVTGLSNDGPENRVLADTLAALLEIPFERITIGDDMWLAYHAAFRPGEGILVYAGTGSAACHVDADGLVERRRPRLRHRRCRVGFLDRTTGAEMDDAPGRPHR